MTLDLENISIRGIFISLKFVCFNEKAENGELLTRKAYMTMNIKKISLCK